MANEIIYKCNSINNKNVRSGELNILRAYPEKLYFEFGENEMNVKKRFYNDVETMNVDFEALESLYKEIKKINEKFIKTGEKLNETIETVCDEISALGIEANKPIEKIYNTTEIKNKEPIKHNKRKRKFN